MYGHYAPQPYGSQAYSHHSKHQKLEHKPYRHYNYNHNQHHIPPVSLIPQSAQLMVPQPNIHPEFPPPQSKPLQNDPSGLTPLFAPRPSPSSDAYMSSSLDTQAAPNNNKNAIKPPYFSNPLPSPPLSVANKIAQASLPLMYTSNGQRTLTPPIPSSSAGISPASWFGNQYLPVPQLASSSWINGNGNINSNHHPNGTANPKKDTSHINHLNHLNHNNAPTGINEGSNILPPPVNAESAASSPQPVNSATCSPVPPPMHPQVQSGSRPRRPPVRAPKPPLPSGGSLLPPIANVPTVNPPTHINLSSIGIADYEHTEMTPALQAQHSTSSPLPMESPIVGFGPMPISPLQPFSPSTFFKGPGPSTNSQW